MNNIGVKTSTASSKASAAKRNSDIENVLNDKKKSQGANQATKNAKSQKSQQPVQANGSSSLATSEQA